MDNKTIDDMLEEAKIRSPHDPEQPKMNDVFQQAKKEGRLISADAFHPTNKCFLVMDDALENAFLLVEKTPHSGDYVGSYYSMDYIESLLAKYIELNTNAIGDAYKIMTTPDRLDKFPPNMPEEKRLADLAKKQELQSKISDEDALKFIRHRVKIEKTLENLHEYAGYEITDPIFIMFKDFSNAETNKLMDPMTDFFASQIDIIGFNHQTRHVASETCVSPKSQDRYSCDDSTKEIAKTAAMNATIHFFNRN